ncbi:amidohydrolase [Mesorhizobium sp. M7D.F.Ca.US.004.01.2.1]|nr:amidohydrolase [Mesorhizobium sp. M7D.F.Ca.US.004.01.2.1]
MSGDLVIRAGRLLAYADADIARDQAVVVADGRIISVGAMADVRVPGNAKVIDAGDCLVMPGLINAHHHVGLTPTQLGADDGPLEFWIARRFGAPTVDPYLDTLCAATDMLARGITCVQHLQGRLFGDPDTFEAEDDRILEAYRDAGMRVSYSRGLTDQCRFVYDADDTFLATLTPSEREAVDHLVAQPVEPAGEQLTSSYHALRGRWQGKADGRIAVQLAPVNLHWCSDELLLRAEDVSRADNVPMHMHVVETPYQAVYAQLRSGGKSAVGHLDALGLLSPRLTMGHSVWLTSDDIRRVRRSGACICHNPGSNFRLMSGLAPVSRFRAEGIPVAIGIDEAGLSDRRDMMDEMRLAWALLQSPGHGETPVDGREVLRMALDDAAATTPFGGTIGRIEPGYSADLILLSWDRIAGAYFDVADGNVSALLRRMVSSSVRTVLVAGRIVHDEGQSTMVDIATAMDELGQRTKAAAALDPVGRVATAAALESGMRRFYNRMPWIDWRSITGESALWKR